MSTDYSMVCHKCHESIHLGQVMAGHWSFGWCTPSERILGKYIDDTRAQGDWLTTHSGHEPVFMVADAVPESYRDASSR